ncbi:hypothetical protein [Desulfosudis oleivorans]|uniref:hypothetical protein n=1 Tax=Desulfosudis oleivorans TaxID=181663 RepID=UPI00129465E0|nr:hypothetical protein [Desulfosudis oleivorans]
MKIIRRATIMLFAGMLLLPAVSRAGNFCLPEHYFTMEEISRFAPARQSSAAIDGFYNPAGAAEPGYADLGWQFLTTAEFSPMAGLGIGLPTLLEIPGFDQMDGLLTHFGGFLALAQFWVDLENQDPMAQMKLAKSGAFWAVGALPQHMVSRAVKISAIGISLIDYSLTTLGTTAIAGNTEYWYRVYKAYYDDQYGHRVEDMAKWEKLIFETYQGDFEKALTEGLMTFWNDVWRHSYEASGHAHAEPLPEAKQQIREAYLAEILPTLKNYFRVQREKALQKVRFEVQYAYDSFREYMDHALKFQGVVQTDGGAPLPGVTVDLPGASAVTTNANGVYLLSVKTCDLVSALTQSGAQNAVLRAAFRPDPPLPGNAAVTRQVTLTGFDRYLPNRINIVYTVTDSRLDIAKTRIENNRRWRLKPTVQDDRGQSLTEGTVTLTAEGGTFTGGNGQAGQITLPARGGTTLWQVPETQALPVSLVATYSGHVFADGRLVRPCQQTFQLPQSLEIPTSVSLSAVKPDPAGLDSTITITVKSVDGQAPATGQLEITAAAGRFLQTGTGRVSLAMAGEKQSVVWHQPDNLDARVTVAAVYQPDPDADIQYQPSRAAISVPIVLPVETAIDTVVTPLDRDNNLWSVSAVVSTRSGDPVGVGAMRAEASAGSFDGGGANRLMDLAQVPQPVLRWQGPPDTTAMVTLTYYGDGLAPDSGNRDFLGSVRQVKLPPETDTQPPVIVFSGARDGAVYTTPVTVRAKVTDNTDKPVTVHAFHSFNYNPSGAFPVAGPDNSGAYSGAATFSEPGRHVVDVMATDAAGNGAREVLAFIIEPVQPPKPEPAKADKPGPETPDKTPVTDEPEKPDTGKENDEPQEAPMVFSPYGGIYD